MDNALCRAAGALALAAGLIAPSVALADITLYEEDFENGPLTTLWDANSKLTTNSFLSTYNGRHSKQGIQLVIPVNKALILDKRDSGSDNGGGGGDNGGGGGDNGGGGGDNGGGNGGGGPLTYSLEFDLYIIDSWDGAGQFGPDLFEVSINDRIAFSESFDNHGGTQSFREPDQFGQFGYNFAYNDAIYRDIRIPINLLEDENEIKVNFRGINLQGFMDESFGIDNVSVTAVPAPASAMLGLVAAGACSRRRRRN